MKSKVLDISKPSLLSCENFGGLEKIAEIDEKNQIISTNLMRLDYISRNRTFYSKEDFIRCLKTNSYINERLEQGVWFGELEHPPKNCSQERFFEINKDEISHRILSYEVKDDIIAGRVQFVAPKGWIPWDWITKNANIAFSVRVYTPNFVMKKDERGIKYVAKYGNMIPITFDCVSMPGYAEARIADQNAYARTVAPTNMTGNNGTKVLMSSESIKSMPNFRLEFENKTWESSLTTEEFKNILSNESAMHILEDVYEFDSNKCTITYGKEGYVNISLPDSTETLSVGVNTYELLKATRAKEINTGRESKSYTVINNPLYTEAQEALANEFDYDRNVEIDEMRSEERLFARLITVTEYEKEIKPILRKQIDAFYSKFDKILKEVFDEEINSVPQKYTFIFEKVTKEKLWNEFKKLYKLSDKSKVLADIDNFVYRRHKWSLSIKQNGKYVPLVRIMLDRKSLKEITTREDDNAPKWGWAAIVSLFLPYVGWVTFPATFAMWIHCKMWRGWNLAKFIKQRIQDDVSRDYAKIVQYGTQDIFSDRRDHMIMMKLNFKISKKNLKRNL